MTLLTYDTGQATRARSAGLDVVKLPTPLEDEPTTAPTSRQHRKQAPDLDKQQSS